jgi:hypothetical protein
VGRRHFAILVKDAAIVSMSRRCVWIMISVPERSTVAQGCNEADMRRTSTLMETTDHRT